MSDDYLYDRSGSDPEVAKLEELLGAYQHDAPLRELPGTPVRPLRARRIALIVAPLLAAAAVILIVLLRRGDDHAPQVATACTGDTGFAFNVTGGSASCGGGATQTGSLTVGAWFETARDGVANVKVADIGELTVFGDSKLRLVGTGPDEHRLELARGKLSAHVVAPPRIFIIDTPAAAAVDLGCAYDMEVDTAGRTHLRVSTGAVSLEGKAGHTAYVLAGHEVEVVPGRGPGTPIAVDTTPAVRAAVAKLDGGDAAGLTALVDAAEPNDMVTLWNVVARTEGSQRAQAVTKLETYAQLPGDVARDRVLSGDPAALEAWRASVVTRWLAPW